MTGFKVGKCKLTMSKTINLRMILRSKPSFSYQIATILHHRPKTPYFSCFSDLETTHTILCHYIVLLRLSLFCIILQLVTAGCLDDAFLLLFVGNNRNIALPVKGLEALRQVRMREVVSCVHAISIHAGKVLLVELDKTSAELSLVAKLVGEGVGFELPLAGEHVDQKVDEGVHGRQGIVEEDETDDDGVLRVESERLVERSIVDEDGEESKNLEEVGLEKKLSDMTQRSYELRLHTWTTPSCRVVCWSCQCPSSWARTAIISSVSWLSRRVSNRTMRLDQGRPVKKALE